MLVKLPLISFAVTVIFPSVLSKRPAKSLALAFAPFTVRFNTLSLSVKAAFNFAAVSAAIVAVTAPAVAAFAIAFASLALTVPKIVTALLFVVIPEPVANTFVKSAIFPEITTAASTSTSSEVLPSRTFNSDAFALSPFTFRVNASVAFASFKLATKAAAVSASIFVAVTLPFTAFAIIFASAAETSEVGSIVTASSPRAVNLPLEVIYNSFNSSNEPDTSFAVTVIFPEVESLIAIKSDAVAVAPFTVTFIAFTSLSAKAVAILSAISASNVAVTFPVVAAKIA
jgi:hypothetical protein